MYDWLKSTTKTLPTSQMCTPGDRDGNGIADSNQALLEEMAHSEPEQSENFLGWLGFDEDTGFNSTPKFKNAEENEDYLSMSATDADYQVSPEQASAKLGEQKTADPGATHSHQMNGFGTLNSDGVTLGSQTKSDWWRDDDGEAAFSTGLSGSVSSDGVLQGGASLKSGDLGVSAKGMLDVDSKGSIQEVAASGSVEFMDNTYKGGGSYKPETVECNGNTVAWSWSGSGQGEMEVMGVGGGFKAKGGETQTATFRTPLEAKMYAEKLKTGEARGADELDSTQLDEMPAGTTMTYESNIGLDLTGSYGAGGAVENEAKRSIKVERGEGSAVTLTLENAEDIAGTGKVSNGVASVSGSVGVGRDQARVYDLDLTNEAHREAFDQFQQTGKLPDVPVREGRDFTDVKKERAMAMPGFSVKQSSTRGNGTMVEDGQEYEAARATNTEEVSTTNAWDMLYGGAKFIGDNCPLSVVGLAGMAYTDYADSPTERKSQQGSRNGTLTGKMLTHQPKDATDEQRWMNTVIEQTEYIDMEDRREAATAFWDAETPTVDHDEVEDVRPLPPHEMMDRKWKLETLIDEPGSFKVMQHLAGRDRFRMEREGAMAVQPAKDVFAWDTTPDGYMDALATLHEQGGPDALEGIRDAAAQNHLERFVSLEGDSNWLDRKGNAELDQQVQMALTHSSSEMAQALIEAELERRSAILSGDYLEIPPSLRDSELARIEERIATLESHQ